jgi:NADH-quinone oxidoreductase subunit I
MSHEKNRRIATMLMMFTGIEPCSLPDECCIACKLCEAVCPAVCIDIDADAAPDGTHRTTRYHLDLFKYIYCGFCEEMCPTDAIVLTRIFEFHSDNRGEQVIHKEQLLAIGVRHESQISANRRVAAAIR